MATLVHGQPIATTAPGHAGFVSRFLAFGIDLVLFLVTLSWGSWFVAIMEDTLGHWAIIDLMYAFLAMMPAFAFFYVVACWRLWGQTLGKWLVGVRVVSISGGPLRPSQCIVRALAYALSALPLYAGFLWVLIDPERRALHNRLARTVVVYVRPHVHPAELSAG